MADGEVLDRATFTSMTEGTQDDWAAIVRASMAHQGEHVDRILSHLKLLDNDYGGFKVDRLEHSLQTATRAHRAGQDEEYVVCALLHDIGDILLPANHAELGAAILKPYVSEQNHWMLEKHGIFQGYYFFHHLGLDRDMRDEWRGHPAFEYTAQFCHLYDQNSFDPAYDTMPLEAFEPMMRRVMATPKRSIYRKPEAA
jgi:predicted HD phosphohydrolase